MKLHTKEPQFLASTIFLGDDIAKQLIEGSRRARPKWVELFQEHREAIPELMHSIRSKLHTIHHPLVGAFIIEWARNIPWGICPSECSNAISINIPSFHLERLARYGGVDSFIIMLGDLANFCCASLGNNDHEFGLILNCPAWLQLASHQEFQSSFEQQIEMVVQHEMAHFRHQDGSENSEIIAHCRGIASFFSRQDLPTSGNEFILFVRLKFPEITQNHEINSLILEGGEIPWRLVRLWLHLFKRYRERTESLIKP
jgi:hypothetical protein